MKDHRMRDGYQKDFTVLETDNSENVDDGVIISGYLFTRYGDDQLFYIRYNLDVVSGDLEYGLAMRAVPCYFEITSKITELDKSLFWVAGATAEQIPRQDKHHSVQSQRNYVIPGRHYVPLQNDERAYFSLLSEIVKDNIINKPFANHSILFNKLQ